MKPNETAYLEYMRTYTGCMKTTPIPLLHAISRFTLLKDKIISDTENQIIDAIAHTSLIEQDIKNGTDLEVDGHLLE